jgi:hypothetical protein
MTGVGTPSTTAPPLWDELQIAVLRREAEAVVLLDPAFPADPSDAREFVSRLDELAIYDHILSLEDERAHCALARPEAGPG